MKKTDFLKEIRGLSKEALQSRAREIAQELMKLRFRKKTRQLEQSSRIRILKRDLARVQTELARPGQAS